MVIRWEVWNISEELSEIIDAAMSPRFKICKAFSKEVEEIDLRGNKVTPKEVE